MQKKPCYGQWASRTAPPEIFRLWHVISTMPGLQCRSLRGESPPHFRGYPRSQGLEQVSHLRREQKTQGGFGPPRRPPPKKKRVPSKHMPHPAPVNQVISKQVPSSQNRGNLTRRDPRLAQSCIKCAHPKGWPKAALALSFCSPVASLTTCISVELTADCLTTQRCALPSAT